MIQHLLLQNKWFPFVYFCGVATPKPQIILKENLHSLVSGAVQPLMPNSLYVRATHSYTASRKDANASVVHSTVLSG